MILKPEQFEDRIRWIINRSRLAENIQDPKEKEAVLTLVQNNVHALKRAYLDLYNEYERQNFGGF